MMNYKELPDENPFLTPVAGTYYAIVTDAEVRESQTTFKPYLSLTYTLVDKDGNERGTMRDIFSEGPKRIPLYKLKKFIDAAEIKIEGDFDFNDLLKLVDAKAFIINTKLSTTSNVPRLEADVYKGDIYYPLWKSSEILGCDVPSEVYAIKNKAEYEEEVLVDGEDMPF
ncbi:hypothetical protein [Clostridium sp.]|uniref:hypothetical protein n=1 Tax=Clostridium sp. TaxID=1506 RepID=UPI001B4AF296|nr:hypothetical protein [Clostridium sp.]MBP3916747.1 hypothetical protein [Clostridium sp.]